MSIGCMSFRIFAFLLVKFFSVVIKWSRLP